MTDLEIVLTDWEIKIWSTWNSTCDIFMTAIDEFPGLTTVFVLSVILVAKFSHNIASLFGAISNIFFAIGRTIGDFFRGLKTIVVKGKQEVAKSYQESKAITAKKTAGAQEALASSGGSTVTHEPQQVAGVSDSDHFDPFAVADGARSSDHVEH